MVRLAAFVRGQLFDIFMLSSIAFATLAAYVPQEAYRIIALVTVISGGAYLLVGAISLLVRIRRRKGLEDWDLDSINQKEMPLTLLNGMLIDYFRHIAFWGVVFGAINAQLFRIYPAFMLGGVSSGDAAAVSYNGFMIWSIAAYIALLAISIVFRIVYLPRWNEDAFDNIGRFFQTIGQDLGVPIGIIKGLGFNQEDEILPTYYDECEESTYSPRLLSALGLLTTVILIALEIVTVLALR